jgi:hypothetical protein
MLSFWEKTALINKDFVVIGAGITGLLTAIELSKIYPKKSICVLERGILPIGATTRNAGFACFGSLSELYYDFQKYPENQVLDLVEQRYKGLKKLLQITGKKAIQFEKYGGYDVINEKHTIAYQNLNMINERLFSIFKTLVFQKADEKIKKFGFNKNVVKHLVYNSLEGQIHSGYLILKLKNLALRKGIELLTGASVRQIENNGDWEHVIIEGDPWRKPLIFTAKQVIVTNNAFASLLIPQLKIEPGRGQVLVTEPIQNLKWKGTFHYDEGFVYFRNIGKRILLGGGRNLFYENEKTYELNNTSEVLNYLNDLLQNVILDGKKVNIDCTWSGIMGFGEKKLPIIQSLRPTLHVAVKFSGMGVALASIAAEKVVQLIPKNI